MKCCKHGPAMTEKVSLAKSTMCLLMFMTQNV